MFVPVTIMMLGVCHHRRSREERSQSCPGEKSSKFHSWYLLKEQWKWRKSTSQGVIRCIENASFSAQKNPQKSTIFDPQIARIHGRY
jgi:hypothetical protein